MQQVRAVLETMEVSNEQLSSELEQRSVEIMQQAHEIEQRDGEIKTLRASLVKQKEHLALHLFVKKWIRLIGVFFLKYTLFKTFAIFVFLNIIFIFVYTIF